MARGTRSGARLPCLGGKAVAFTLTTMLVLMLTLTAAASSTTQTQDQKLTPTNTARGQWFGQAVAVDDSVAVIGGHFDSSGQGAAWVFELSSGSWSQVAKLTASDGSSNDYFGCTVAVDDDTAVIGAFGSGSAGAAYVFVRTSTGWSQQAKLTSSDGASGDQYGYAVAVSGDAIAVGAFGDDDNGSSSGSVYVYVRSGTTWSQQQKITPSDGAASDAFGISVALDGNTLLAGAYLDDDDYTNSGSAYVFGRSGTAWSQAAKLNASGPGTTSYFGYRVALCDDVAVIGAHNQASGGGAYVFEKSGTSWLETADLTASDGQSGDEFGIAVDVCDDFVVVGARYAGDSGAAYVYVRDGSTWDEDVRLYASDAALNDLLGNGLGVSGTTAIVGAFGDEKLAGSAYVYELTPPNSPPTCAIANDGGDTITVECASTSGTEVTLVGSATDPDADTLTITWSSAVTLEDTDTLQPTGVFPYGETSVTLTVTDPSGASSSFTVDVIVEDTTAPSVDAWFANVRLSRNGIGTTGRRMLQARCSATDLCDANPTVTLEIEVAGIADAVTVTDGTLVKWVRIPSCWRKPRPRVRWRTIAGYAVLMIRATAIELSCSATDAAGNTATDTATP